MEHYKIFKLLSDLSVSKFGTIKCIKVNYLSSGHYSVNKNIRLKTPMLRSGLCNFGKAYIVVKQEITVERNNARNREDKKLTFKNKAAFRSCIAKINNTK